MFFHFLSSNRPGLPEMRKCCLISWIALLMAASQCTPAGASCQGFGENRCQIDIELHKSHVQVVDQDITRASVADPNIADIQIITPRQILILAKEQPGITNLILWHGDDNANIYDLRVFIPGDIFKAIRERIRLLVPGARVDVVPSRTGAILNGQVNSLGMLDKVLKVVKSFDIGIVNMISVVGSQQVQLEVKIAEVSKSGAKQMGLGFLNNSDWNIGLFPSGTVSGTTSTSKSMVPETKVTKTDTNTGIKTEYTEKGGLSTDMASKMELMSPFASAFQLAAHSVSGNTLAILSILKGQGLARFLASPTLVTMSGQDAEFLVGGEFPVPITGADGLTTIEYKQFGILLRFTPVVVGHETITIQVAPEVSNVDYSLSVFSGGVSVPGIKTRRGSTTLQLKDGQSFIMAGLLKEESSTAVSKIPFLGDLPILGTLFTSKEFQKDESELMIVVTPRLVRALNPDELPPLPGEDQVGNIGDVDFYLLNRLSKTEAKTEPKVDPAPEAAKNAPEAPRDPAPAAHPAAPSVETEPVSWEFEGTTGFAN